jgi:predicted transcriptional regulator
MGLNQANENTGGVGIGLSTSQTLIEYLGGKLLVQSSAEGTQVEFSLLTTSKDYSKNFSADVKKYLTTLYRNEDSVFYSSNQDCKPLLVRVMAQSLQN